MTTNTNRKTHSKADIRAALAHVQRLCVQTPTERAEQRFAVAKREFTAATEALMREDPGSTHRADKALIELNQARAELARLDEREEKP